MATNYPGSIDNSTSLPYPSSGNFTNGPSLAGGQDNQNDAIIATQTKLGSGASTPTNNNLLIGTGMGTSAWSKVAPTGAIVGTTDTQTLTNKTFTSPIINNPVISNATITADVIAGFTSANSGTVYGIAIASGAITGANTVNGSALVSASVPGSAIVAGGIGTTQLANSSVTVAKMNFPSFNGSTDANGWTTFTNGNGKTCYAKAAASTSMTLPAGVSLGSYTISGPVGVTLSYTNCIVTGAFMGNSDRAVTSYIYSLSSSSLSVACANLFTGGGFTFTPQYQVVITML